MCLSYVPVWPRWPSALVAGQCFGILAAALQDYLCEARDLNEGATVVRRSHVNEAPPDPILAVGVAFAADPVQFTRSMSATVWRSHRRQIPYAILSKHPKRPVPIRLSDDGFDIVARVRWACVPAR